MKTPIPPLRECLEEGVSLEEAAKIAVETAREAQHTIRVRYGDLTLLATPTSRPSNVIQHYFRLCRDEGVLPKDWHAA